MKADLRTAPDGADAADVPDTPIVVVMIESLWIEKVSKPGQIVRLAVSPEAQEVWYGPLYVSYKPGDQTLTWW